MWPAVPSSPHAPRTGAPSPTARLAALAARAENPLLALCIVVGSVVRFTPSTPLWLDEALTVNIASQPLGDIGGLLKRDGHPPLFYWLLHGWIELFGTGASAVRALSGLFGLGAMAMLWVVARRLGGVRLAWWSTATLAMMPYGIRYSSEARMYELVTLLALVGWWLVDRTLSPAEGERPGRVAPWTLAALWVLSGALLLTNYWAIFLLAGAGLGLVISTWRAHRAGERDAFLAHVKVMAAIALGGVLFLPWLPTFRYQSAHTGTPWAPASRPTRIVSDSVLDWVGGIDPEAILAFALCAVLVTLGLFATDESGRLTLGGLASPWRARLLWIIGATLAIGSLASLASSAAFAGRYASVVFPFWVLLVAAGLLSLPSQAVRTGALALLLVFNGATVGIHLKRDRTQAGAVAAVVNAEARSGDLVVVCPDQLGPSLERLVRVDGVRIVRYPDLGDPRFVDWVDYAERLEAVSVPEVAERILAAAGTNDLWFVWAGAYRVAGPQCDELSARLAAARPGTSPDIDADGVRYFEPSSLLRLRAPAPAPGATPAPR